MPTQDETIAEEHIGNPDKRYFVKPKKLLDVKKCNCARCGRELLGLADRDQAHHLRMEVVTYVLDRPYCRGCGQDEGAKRVTCACCGDNPFRRDAYPEKRIVEGVEQTKTYCLCCSSVGPSPSRPLPLGCRTDAHERTTVPGHGAKKINWVIDTSDAA